MKRDVPTQAGVGFTIFVAAATFAIAVVAGIFLIHQSETTSRANAQWRALAQAQMSLAEAPDIQRALRMARSTEVTTPPRVDPGALAP
jgi:sensor histidine kinase regulating citrate/malate metabolism